MADSSHHAVIAVVLAVRDGKLDASLRRVERAPGEALEAALARATDLGALAYVEQLDTRLLPDGTLATAYLGLGTTPMTSDMQDDDLVRAARARLRAKLSYTNVGF